MSNLGKIDHATKLKTDLAILLQSEELCDIVFLFDGEERIPALKPFLMTRSAYFEKMFLAGMRESSEKEIRLKKTPAEAFKALLRYLYTAELDFTSMKQDTVIDLLELANRHIETDLETAITLYLKSIFTVKLVCEILQTQFVHSIPSFLEDCLQFVDRNCQLFCTTGAFTQLGVDQMELIFERDSFRPGEEQLFDVVVEWIEANGDLEKEHQKRILDTVRFLDVPYDKLRKFARKTGLLSEKEIRRARTRCILPRENVATIKNSAKVVVGSSRLNATNIFDEDKFWQAHEIGKEGESIMIKLDQPYMIGSMRFCLHDFNYPYHYSYYVEVSPNGRNWYRVADRTQERCTSWQELQFPTCPLQFVKIVGTYNSGNDDFYVTEFECPSKNFPL